MLRGYARGARRHPHHGAGCRYARLTLGTSGIPFGDLTLCSFIDLPNLNSLTVRQYLASMNTALGGGSAIYDIDPALTLVTFALDASFKGDSP